MNEKSLGEALGLNVRVFDRLPSTTSYLAQRIREGESWPDLVLAKGQSEGRGRSGKSFYSPYGTGLYMTFAIPSCDASVSHLTPRCAVALHRAVKEVFSLDCGIKWVNDLYLSGRKVAGILCTRTEPCVLIGVGVNVERPDVIPDELADRFGTLTDICCPSKYEALVIAFYRALQATLTVSEKDLLLEYRARCIHLGKQVRLVQNGTELCGVCIGLGDDFSLQLEVDGTVSSFTSGMLLV